MRTVCEDYWKSGRSRQQPARKAVRTTKPTHRREVLHIGDDGVRVRRHSPILLQLRVEGTQTEQERYRSTTPGMDRAEGDYPTTTPETSSVVYHSTLQLSARSSELGGSSIVRGMSSLSVRRTVTFDKRITVITLTDWPTDVYRAARKGQWMQLAVDRHRFKRRIQQTELELGNIFTDDHRDKMWFYVNKLCV